MNWNIIGKINIFTNAMLYSQCVMLRKKYFQKFGMDNNSFFARYYYVYIHIFHEYIFFARNVLLSKRRRVVDGGGMAPVPISKFCSHVNCASTQQLRSK